MNEEQRRERLKEIEVQWTNLVEQQKAEFGDDFIAKEFTMNQTERRRVQEFQAMREFLSKAIDDILNLDCLPRVGVPTEGTKLLYNVALGRFVTFTKK